MNTLAQEVKQVLNIELNPRQIKAFDIYETELNDWNEKFNLTAIRDSAGIRTKHFLDSLTCLLAWKNSPPDKLIDIGTGAGFPGIPLKILFPQINLTLVESVGKKLQFCRHITETLQLERVSFIQARAEELGAARTHREQYDWAVARAVANLPVLSEYLLPLVRVGGHVLAQKGESAPAEAQSAEKAIQVLGGHLQRLVPVLLPGVAETRYLVLIDKIATTPSGYPRRVGLPAKRPIGVELQKTQE
jgi:16S rRNA (guanine527-N7)-methyltransferase